MPTENCSICGHPPLVVPAKKIHYKGMVIVICEFCFAKGEDVPPLERAASI